MEGGWQGGKEREDGREGGKEREEGGGREDGRREGGKEKEGGWQGGREELAKCMRMGGRSVCGGIGVFVLPEVLVFPYRRHPALVRSYSVKIEPATLRRKNISGREIHAKVTYITSRVVVT